MKQLLGTKVTISRKNEKSGKIEIEYYSPEELEHLLEMLYFLLAMRFSIVFKFTMIYWSNVISR